MEANENATCEKILSITRHTKKLLSFTMTRPKEFRFQAGQFARLGFDDVWRAYSIVSSEYDETLTFFVVLIESGPMSRYFEKMKVGDEIKLGKDATGFLLPGRFPDGEYLLMLSTGSGIAPFISQLQEPKLFERFHDIALVHSVSYLDEFVFDEFFDKFAEHPLVGSHSEQLTYIKVCTREKSLYLNQRIPDLLKLGTLQEKLPFQMDPKTTRIMICGNPDMVMDTFNQLKDMGYKMHRIKVSGEIIMENGF